MPFPPQAISQLYPLWVTWTDHHGAQNGVIVGWWIFDGRAVAIVATPSAGGGRIPDDATDVVLHRTDPTTSPSPEPDPPVSAYRPDPATDA